MKSKIDKKNKTGVIKLSVENVHEDAVELSQIANKILESGVEKLIFNMEETKLIDSSSLGALVFCRKKYPPNKVKMVISNASGYAKDILVNSNFETLFEFENCE